MFDVISIGSATLDVFIRCREFKLLKTDEVFTGEAIMAPYGAKNEVDQLVAQSGGGATNTAVGFARLGLKSASLARCGVDLAGQMAREEIEKEGVDSSLLIQVEGDETDYSTILIGPDGGRSILIYRGGTKIEWELIDFTKIKSRWFYITSLEGNSLLLQRLVHFAEENKIKVALNPGRKELAYKERLIPILNKVDVVILNREEAARLTGLTIDDSQVFLATAEMVKEVAVITDGKKGATLYTQEEKMLTGRGLEVEAVDTTGAGDGFGCGFIGGLAMGWDLEKALKLGICNGASIVTKVGAKSGLLTRDEAEKWIEEPLKMEWK